jgi:hypothetical protein
MLNTIRAILAAISTGSVVSFVIFGLIAGSQFKGNDVTKWKEDDGGFNFHIISTTSEWICAGCTMTYLLCFVWDFRRITLNEPEIFVHDDVAVPLKIYRK